MTRTQTRLLTVGRPHPVASIIDLRARRSFRLPIGNDNEDLLCGACGTVVLAGWFRSSTAKRHVVDSQILIRCGRCRVYNVVATARLAEEPREALAMVHNRLKGLYMRSSSAGAAAECHFGTAPTTTTRLCAFVVIAISDNDSGMSAAILKRAFEPFFATTAEDTVTKVRGFGQCVRQLESSPCCQPPTSASHSRTTIGTRVPTAIGCIQAYERFIELALGLSHK